MGHDSCCVVNCKNTGRNSTCVFYRFPTAKWKLEQRNKWIAAVKRKNKDGSPWYPKARDCICSQHFIGGKKSNEMASPSYVPVIFPSIYGSKKINEPAIAARYERFLARKNKKKLADTIPKPRSQSLGRRKINWNENHRFKVSRGCQAEISPEFENEKPTFTCNRYIYSGLCHAEIQTEIPKKWVLTNSYKKDNEVEIIEHVQISQAHQRVMIFLPSHEFA